MLGIWAFFWWTNIVAGVATTATSLAGLAAVDYVDGAIALAPNTAVTIQQIKTTADSGIISMVWAEIPV